MPSLSQYGQLIDATVAAITGATLALAVTVDSRKRPAVLDTDTLPLVLCFPKLRQYVDLEFTNLAALSYSIGIAVITAHTDFLKQGMDTEQLLLEQIAQTLYALPAGISTAYDVVVDLNPTYDPAGLDQRYDYSFLEVTFTNQEVRN